MKNALFLFDDCYIFLEFAQEKFRDNISIWHVSTDKELNYFEY
jgi:hypothetical protein